MVLSRDSVSKGLKTEPHIAASGPKHVGEHNHLKWQPRTRPCHGKLSTCSGPLVHAAEFPQEKVWTNDWCIWISHTEISMRPMALKVLWKFQSWPKLSLSIECSSQENREKFAPKILDPKFGGSHATKWDSTLNLVDLEFPCSGNSSAKANSRNGGLVSNAGALAQQSRQSVLY